MLSGIYAIYSKTTPRVYIGQTGRRFCDRFYNHKRSLLTGKHPNVFLQRHVDKHGIGDLEFVPLLDIREELTKHEGLQAQNHTSMGFELFNLDAISNYVPRAREVSSKLSAIHKSLWSDPEYRLKMLPHLRYERTEETRKKQSDSRKAWWDSNPSMRSYYSESKGQAIDILKDGVVLATYPSTRSAVKALNLSQARVWLCLNGKAQTHKGYTFRYTEQTDIEIEN